MSDKIGIILASHGPFAEGALHSAEMIVGKQEMIAVDTFKDGSTPESLHTSMLKSIDEFGTNSKVLFMVDLWGGTPFNQAGQIVSQNPDRMALVAGLNLPMLVEASSSRTIMPFKDLVSHISKTAKDGVRNLNIQALLKNSDDKEDLL